MNLICFKHCGQFCFITSVPKEGTQSKEEMLEKYMLIKYNVFKCIKHC